MRLNAEFLEPKKEIQVSDTNAIANPAPAHPYQWAQSDLDVSANVVLVDAAVDNQLEHRWKQGDQHTHHQGHRARPSAAIR
jgi:hypothetical protein